MRVSEPYTLFPRTLKSGKTVYYYQYRMDNGARSTAKSTGCTTLSSAKRFCNQLYNSGEFEKTSSTRFCNYADDFFSKTNSFYQWKKVSKSIITDNSLDRYNQLLKYQLLPYFGNFQLSAITRQDVKKWIVWASSKWSDKTVNNAQTVFNHIMNQAVEDNIIKFNPAVNLSFRQTEKKERELLTIPELNSIYHSDGWTSEKHKQAFLVATITGMRIGEVVALQNNDVTDTYLNVVRNWTKKFGESDGKTHTKRYVPKPAELKLHNNDNEWIFEDNSGKPINISRIHDNLWKIMELLGIDYRKRNLNTHTLRNFFISYLLSENIPKEKVKAVVGHKDKDMTDWYTYWKPDMFPDVYIAQLKLYKAITEEQ